MYSVREMGGAYSDSKNTLLYFKYLWFRGKEKGPVVCQSTGASSDDQRSCVVVPHSTVEGFLHINKTQSF